MSPAAGWSGSGLGARILSSLSRFPWDTSVRSLGQAAATRPSEMARPTAPGPTVPCMQDTSVTPVGKRGSDVCGLSSVPRGTNTRLTIGSPAQRRAHGERPPKMLTSEYRTHAPKDNEEAT